MLFITVIDKRALQLGSRFCLPPNSLGYCGRGTAPEKFKSCVIDGDCREIEEEFSKFIVFYPYIKTVSQLTGLHKYSHEVIESYWLGNDQLKKAELKHFKILLENFEKQGVPGWLIEELKTTPPKEFIPHHLFQVLYIGVGRASGSVPFNLDSSNNCMIRWGKVKKIKGDEAEVALKSLAKKDQRYKLIELKEKHPFDPRFFSNLRAGDVVAVHWRQIVKKLSAKETKNLSYWTSRVIKAVSRL